MTKSLLFIVFFFIFQTLFSQAFKIDEFKADSSFAKANYKVIQQIQLVGNKVTKPKIVLREIIFRVGDTLFNDQLSEALEQSKKNILNTSLFNFAKLDVALIDSVHAIVIVNLTERWYLFPLPIFEIDDNNFNTWWRDKDYSRINYGMHLTRNNFRGRKEKVSLTAKYGFSERYRLKYSIPFIDSSQKSGLSFSFSYNRKDEIVYTTFDNERLLYKNFDGDAVRNYSANIAYSYRQAIYNTHVIGIEYDHNSIVDTVRKLNPNFLGDNQKQADFFSLYYVFVNDKRDSRNYPLKGRFLKFGIQKYGLNILDSPVDLMNFSAELKKYMTLTDRVYFATSLTGIVAANDNQPYLLQNGLGYSSFGIRSYEYYVIDGQNIGLAKAQIKYQIVKPNSFDLGFGPKKFSKFHYAFYLGLFSDVAYVEDQIGFEKNDLANEIQFGTGIGLDFVSYYDIVIRTEFSINKFGERGIFLHFVAPI